jgi:hypothetical protein
MHRPETPHKSAAASSRVKPQTVAQ